jgi:hypothetical protein
MTNDTDDPTIVAKDAAAGSIYIQTPSGTWYKKLDAGSTTSWSPVAVGSGTDNHLPRWDGGTPGTLQDSGVILDDSDNMTGVLTAIIGDILISGNTISTPTATQDLVLDTTGLGEIHLDSPTVLNHTATANDQYGLEIMIDAANFSDIKAVDIVYDVGTIGVGEDEAGILINIDKNSSTGGQIEAIDIVATEGTADVHGIHLGVGIDPIHHESGAFVSTDASYVYDDSLITFTTATAQFDSAVSNLAIFTEDNDVVYVGRAQQFSEIEFILGTFASGSGIAPTFEYSDGVGGWTTFVPVDGTNGMRNNGVVDWDPSSLAGWAQDTVYASSGLYWVRVTRTRNSLSVTPVEISQGSVLFAGANGEISEDNVNLNFNDSTDTFSLIGTATHTGNHDHFGSLVRNGSTDLIGDLSQTGNYDLIGQMSHSGQLNQYGDVLLIGDQDLIGTLSQTGSHDLIGDKSHIGNSTQTGSMDLTGYLSHIGTATRTGQSFLVGYLSQTGDMDLNGDLAHIGDLSRTGLTELTGGLSHIGDATRTGTTHLLGDMTQSGSFNLFGDFSHTGNASTTGTYVFGSAQSQSDITSNGAFFSAQFVGGNHLISESTKITEATPLGTGEFYAGPGLQVTTISAGSNITITSASGSYTINSVASGGLTGTTTGVFYADTSTTGIADPALMSFNTATGEFSTTGGYNDSSFLGGAFLVSTGSKIDEATALGTGHFYTGGLVESSISGVSNQTTANFVVDEWVIGTVQDIATTSDVTFNSMSLTGFMEMSGTAQFDATPTGGSGLLRFNGSTGNVELKRDDGTVKVLSQTSPIQVAATCVILHRENSGVNGGDATSGSWEQRTLNVLENNCNAEFGLSGNILTHTPAGTADYEITFCSNFYVTGFNKSRFLDNTSGRILIDGDSGQASGGGASSEKSCGTTTTTLTTTGYYELESRVSNTNLSDGYGTSNGFGTPEVYLWIRFKELE